MVIKNRFLNLVAFSLLFLAIASTSVAQEIPPGIVESFKKGNAKELSRHFNDNVELVVLANEDVYSKSQAELILRDFFSANAPVKFELLHQGGPVSSRFGIGSLATKNGDFRIYFLLKRKDEVYLIHLLRIERAEAASLLEYPDFEGGDYTGSFILRQYFEY